MPNKSLKRDAAKDRRAPDGVGHVVSELTLQRGESRMKVKYAVAAETRCP